MSIFDSGSTGGTGTALATANTLVQRDANGATALNGVQFPAAQVASADPNMLDDYEEGTCTPTIRFGGASAGVTYTSQLGTYTKIGDRVTVTMDVDLSNKGSSVGTATMGGFPFAAAAAPFSVGTVRYHVVPTPPVGAMGTWVDVLPSTATAQLSYWASTGNEGALADTNFGNSTAAYVTVTYKV